jgi:hypothetical protein
MLKEHKELLADQAERLAHDFERTYHGCSQAVLRAVLQVLGCQNEQLFNGALPLAGGFGLKQELCGAVAGGAMALGAYSKKYGRHWDDFNKYDIDTLLACLYAAGEFEDKCREAFGGTVSCREITKHDFSDRANIFKYIESPEFEACCVNCGKVARLVVEMLLSE